MCFSMVAVVIKLAQQLLAFTNSTDIFRNHNRELEFSMSQIEQMDNFRCMDLVDHDLKIGVVVRQHLVQPKFILKV